MDLYNYSGRERRKIDDGSVGNTETATAGDRSITNLGKVFGQFAELQQQIAEQVVSPEDSVYHQRQDIASAMAQLPELRERIKGMQAAGELPA
jgi:hypothetical protein